MNDPTANSEIIHSLLKDHKADRRWRNIRFFGWMFILLLYAALIFAPSPAELGQKSSKEPYVSLVRMNGLIMPNMDFSAFRMIPQLQKAFSDKEAKGVILVINSPGGSPVQASIIHDKILELKKEYKKKVVVVGEDALVSGAYLVATAGDKIYVNPDTLTGSIGVVMSGFGFTDAIKKLGVTRRLFIAGENKARLDPFEPLKPSDTEKINTVLTQVHRNFINSVVADRGPRLRGDQQEIFSGDFWTGEEAVSLGIADGTSNLWTVLQEEFAAKHYRDYTKKATFIDSLFHTANTALHLHLMDDIAPLREQAY